MSSNFEVETHIFGVFGIEFERMIFTSLFPLFFFLKNSFSSINPGHFATI